MEEQLVADLLHEVRLWAASEWDGSYQTRSRRRLQDNKRRGLMAAEEIVEAGVPGLEWLLERKSLLVELGRCRPDVLVPVAKRVARARLMTIAGCRAIWRWSGRSVGTPEAS